MITVFSDFQQFSVKKLALFSKTNVMINFLHNLVLFSDKNANFYDDFLAKIYFLNHNIGPRTQSYDVWTYNANASVVVCRLELFYTKEK
jgi:hypothetical protein